MLLGWMLDRVTVFTAGAPQLTMTTSMPTPSATACVPTVASPICRNPSRGTGAKVDASTACAAYLDYLRHEFGAGELLWRTVYGLYGRLACDRGWPILSEKALSQGLTALDCRSQQRDLRGEGKGRPRELVWTSGTEDDPLRDAA